MRRVLPIKARKRDGRLRGLFAGLGQGQKQKAKSTKRKKQKATSFDFGIPPPDEIQEITTFYASKRQAECEGEGPGQGSQAWLVKSPGGEAKGNKIREMPRDKGPKAVS